jgi:flavin reductase (DIM6/NTAB) family NADH-FMN oxidoreductase RutF
VDAAVEDFRRVMRHYPTGVVVVAACRDGQPYGMTVNSFTSVSLDPLLVMFCAGRSSRTWPILRYAGWFAVSILSDSQGDLCRTFASSGRDRFAGVAWSLGKSGQPVLDDATAWLECEIADVLPAGDHEIALGRVRYVSSRPGVAPLIYHGGGFGTLGTQH